MTDVKTWVLVQGKECCCAEISRRDRCLWRRAEFRVRVRGDEGRVKPDNAQWAEKRRTVKKQMERVVAEAHAQLEQMYEADRQLRLEFKTDHGEYLPSDIWRGANTLPPRYAITRADEQDAASVPELPRRTVEEALRRLKNDNSARAGR